MGQLVHLGIEYGDLTLHIVILADGSLHPLETIPLDQAIGIDINSSISSLGVGFPSLIRNVGTIESMGFEHAVQQFFQLIRKAIEGQFGRRFCRTVIAVPMALTSACRSILLKTAKAAGVTDVELVDALVLSGIVFASGRGAPTTQLVYYLGYGECEYALLRVLRGRIKVLDSGIVTSVSGQLFDLQLMEAIVLALREKNVFLGLNSFRKKQWLEFRNIVARARENLGKTPFVEVTLPPSLVHTAAAIRMTLSAAGAAARFTPSITTTIDDVNALLERNDVKAAEVDAVIALGDTATRSPVAALLAEAFPGKVMIGDIGTVAAAAAAYPEWTGCTTEDAGSTIDLSYYLSPYQGQPELAAGAPADALVDARVTPPVVRAVVVEESATIETAPAQVRTPPASVDTPEAAKALIDQRRYREAAELLGRLASPGKRTAPGRKRSR
jgi:hypothetical protein